MKSKRHFFSQVSDRVLALLSVLPAAILGLVFICRSSGKDLTGNVRFTLFDDALISMSYGKTLAQTGELVWYPGADRVEGFSNPLWTLYMAFLHWVGLSGNAAMIAVSVSGLCTVLATGILVFYLAKRVSFDRQVWFACSLASSLTFSLVFWSLRGMEVGVITVCAAALALLAIKAQEQDSAWIRWCTAAVIVVGFGVRMDFAVVVAVVAGWALWCSPGRRAKTLLLYVAPLFGAVLTLSLFRLWYYGEVVPNTYTLKMTGVSLADRLARGLLMDVKLLPVLLIAGYGTYVLATRGSVLQQKIVLLYSVASISVIAYSTYVGGDAWETFPNRFVTPGLVFATVLAISGLSFVLKKYWGWVSGLSAALVVLLFTSFSGYRGWIEQEKLHIRDDINAANWMEGIQNVTSEDAVVAVAIAGAGGYYTDRIMVDILGKTDPHIANLAPRIDFYPGHDRWDYDYTFNTYEPDVIGGLWISEPKDFDLIRSKGYSFYCLRPELENAIAVKDSSEKVNRSLLYECPNTFLSLPFGMSFF